MYLRKLFLLAMSCGMASLMFAQEVPKVIPPSPVAAAIQRYGDYPASNYTGIPDIKIPIYTIEAGDIKVPIYLSYHAAGTQLSDLEGTTNYVGLGWTLQTGGVVSRTINGLPDDQSNLTEHEGWGNNYTSEYYSMKALEDGGVDHEYDIYSYSFLGRSGKFIANPDAKPNQTEPPKPFLFNNDGLKINSGGPLGFSISDEEGRGFAFYGNDAIEFADYTTYNGILKSAQSSWYLKSIGSSKYPGTSVWYYYQQGPSFWKYSNSATWILDSWINSELDYYHYPYSRDKGNNLVNSSSSVFYKTYLPYTIHFPSGIMYFTLDASKMLSKIEVFDKQNNLIKTVNLQIGSFNGLAPKLMSVTFKDAAGKQQETYSFNYFNENGTNVPLGKDHWGFLNGAPYSQDYIMPFSLTNVSQGFYQTINVNRAGANREPNADFAKTFTLKRITYPTKGYTEFEYEGNRTDDNMPVGGLRIKTISGYLQDGELASQKNYTYKSSGSLEVLPNIELYRKSTTFMINNLYESHRRHFSDFPLLDLMPKGCPIVYTKVTEKEGQLTTEYGYEDGPAYEYDYMNFPGHYSGENGDFKYKKFAHNYRPWNFGNLSYKRSFGPGFENLETYNYEEFLSDTTHDLLFERVVDATCMGSGGSMSCDNYHEIKVHTGLYSSLYNYSKRYFLSGGNRLVHKATSTSGSDGELITTGTSYFYDNPAYPTLATRQTTINSKGEEILSEFKHATDFPAQAPYTTMVDWYWIAPVIKQINSIVKPGGNQLLSSTTTNYINWGNDLIAPGTIDVEKNGDTYTAVRFSQYDAKGNITQMSKENNPKLSFLWDYNGTLPVAECTNAEVGQIAYTSFETEEKGNWVFNGTPVSETGAPTGKKAYLLNGSNAITRTIPDNKDYIVSYWTNNVSAFSIPGTKTDYPLSGNTVNGWHYFEHQVSGQPSVTINGSGLIDELRFYPATAQMATYTYAPLIGMTSVCDIKNSIKYYEYDAAGRMSVVRDQDKNVLQKVCYNYSGQQIDCGGTIFYSKAKCQQFTKQGCAVDYYADTYDYCVPAEKYSSTQSQEAADALVDADIAMYGQTTANQKTECHKMYFNPERTEVFRRTDCLGGVPGSPVPVTIAARTFWTLVDQKTADDWATNWLNTWGPIRAIENGTCLTYGNHEINQVFESQLCDLQGGYRPNPYPVYIAENTIISTVSQQDADNKAYNQAVQAANDNGGCYLYYTVPLLLDNSTGYNDFTFELVKENDESATFFFDADGESYGLLGYVAEGEYTVNFYSDYYNTPFMFMVGCESPGSDYRGITLYHQTINASCNILEIF